MGSWFILHLQDLALFLLQQQPGFGELVCLLFDFFQFTLPFRLPLLFLRLKVMQSFT